MFCPKCGAQNDDNATFCASCGNSLKADTSQPPMGSPASPGQPGAQVGGSSGMDIKGTFMDAIALVRDPKAFMTARADAAPPVNRRLDHTTSQSSQSYPLYSPSSAYLAFPRSSRHVYAIGGGIVAYIFALVSVVVVGYIVFMLAPRFASVADLNKATKLVSYVYTPVFLIAVVNIVPFLTFLNILALLYGLYIVYIGLPIVLKTPPTRW